jgi:hypothetical protein
LDNGKEEDIQIFFTKNYELFDSTYGLGGGYVIPKFKFGNEFISDFVIVFEDEGSMPIYFIYLIELEPCTAKIYNKDLTYAKRLNGALAQIDKWKNWINKNYSYFIESINKSLGNLGYEDNEILYGKIYFYSKIIIGRRNMLNKEANERRTNEYLQTDQKLEIATYDRFLDTIEEKMNDVNKLLKENEK